jgi:gamma-glutamyltranspeptidase/glutathione hydrolase
MVVSGHPLASGAGLRVLADGGTAVDAALAASGVLAVVRPAWCGPGGDGFALLYTPERGVVALNGSGAAPLAAAPGLFPEGRVPRFGARSVAVPGLIDAWSLAAADYASRPLEHLLAPAIHYARDGFPVDRRLGQAIAAIAPDLAQWPALARLLAPGGDLVQPGEVLRQPELAATLATVATEGRAAFYGGALGQTVVDALARRGGLLAAADLARHGTAWQAPLATPYGGRVVYGQPLVSLGCILLEMLNIVDGYDLVGLRDAGSRAAGLGPNGADERDEPSTGPWAPSAALIDRLVRAKEAAFADAARYLGDPAIVDVPLDRLLSAAHAAAWRARLADPASVVVAALGADGSDTDCLVTADGDGRVVVWIQSLFNLFGAREVADGTGLLLNDRLANLPVDPTRPNALRPGHKPLHTLNTFMVCEAGRPLLAGATPGGQGQVQTNLQLITAVLDFGLDVQAAVDAPRWVSGSRLPTDRTLYLEPRFPPAVAEALRALGHTVAIADQGDDGERFGSATLVGVDGAGGVLSGGADPRRGALALGL